MYYLYKQGIIPQTPELSDNLSIVRQPPHPFIDKVDSMQMGRRRFWYFTIMTFLCRGIFRVFEEYDVIKDGIIVSKAVLISKVPLYRFLPRKGIHLCYCETIPEARGKGYYPMLLSYIQNQHKGNNLYMIVDEKNISSIRGIEKAGFVRCGKVEKQSDGIFVNC